MKSWQCLGGPGSLSYAVYDVVRRRLNRTLAAYLTAKTVQGGGTKILEAGSGPASASSLLARHPGVLSVALDLDLEALREARRRDPALPVVVGDLRHLPFRTGAFDLVWNSSTLEHLDEPHRALVEMRRIVGQSGYVFVGVPYRSGPLGFQPWVKNTRLGRWLGQVFSQQALRTAMQQACLEPIDSMSYFFRFFIGVLARKV